MDLLLPEIKYLKQKKRLGLENYESDMKVNYPLSCVDNAIFFSSKDGTKLWAIYALFIGKLNADISIYRDKAVGTWKFGIEKNK